MRTRTVIVVGFNAFLAGGVISSALISWFNVQAIRAVDTRMTSRLDELLATTRRIAFAAGQKEEQDRPSPKPSPTAP